MADEKIPVDRIDPAVTIPAGVKASIDAAKAAHETAYGAQNADNKDGKSAELARNGANGADGGTITLAPEPQHADSTSVPGQDAPQNDGGQRSGAGESPTEPSNSASQLTAEQVQEDWERKFRALKGRYDRTANENAQLAGRLSSMEQVLSNITPRSNPAAQNGATLPPQSDDFSITPQEVADYGEEFLTVIEKKAKQVLMPTIHKLEQENEQLKRQLGQVGSTVNVNSKVNLERYMDDNLNNWRDLNQNEEFLGWLAQTDPYSGTVRHDLLKQAYDRNDSGRVLAFFRGFLADEATVAPRGSNATSGAGVTPQSNGANPPPPKVPLERLAAPGRARTAASSGAPAEKPTIRRDQIAAFYAQVAAGKFAGNDAERDRLENMIFEAQREGRIT